MAGQLDIASSHEVFQQFYSKVSSLGEGGFGSVCLWSLDFRKILQYIRETDKNALSEDLVVVEADDDHHVCKRSISLYIERIKNWPKDIAVKELERWVKSMGRRKDRNF